MAIFSTFHVVLGLLLLKNVLNEGIASRKRLIFPQNMIATTRPETALETTRPGTTPGTARSDILETRDADDLARERRDNATINQLIG